MVTPAELPPNTRFDAEVVDKLAGVPAIGGPFKVNVLPVTAKVPEVRVRVPLMVVFPHRVIPPERFIVKF